MTTNDYDIQKDQFLFEPVYLLTKDRFCSNHFELCYIMRVGRKQHILSTTLDKTKITRSQRNSKDNTKMKYCRWVAGRRQGADLG
jgi:hypothetical protein